MGKCDWCADLGATYQWVRRSLVVIKYGRGRHCGGRGDAVACHEHLRAEMSEGGPAQLGIC